MRRFFIEGGARLKIGSDNDTKLHLKSRKTLKCNAGRRFVVSISKYIKKTKSENKLQILPSRFKRIRRRHPSQGTENTYLCLTDRIILGSFGKSRLKT